MRAPRMVPRRTTAWDSRTHALAQAHARLDVAERTYDGALPQLGAGVHDRGRVDVGRHRRALALRFRVVAGRILKVMSISAATSFSTVARPRMRPTAPFEPEELDVDQELIARNDGASELRVVNRADERERGRRDGGCGSP